MISFDEEFENMDKQYTRIIRDYRIFKTKTTKENQEKLLKSIDALTGFKNKFRSRVKNLFIGKKANL